MMLMLSYYFLRSLYHFVHVDPQRFSLLTASTCTVFSGSCFQAVSVWFACGCLKSLGICILSGQPWHHWPVGMGV